MIECKNVSYKYETFEKKAGLKGSILDFGKREKKEVTALDDINLSIVEGDIIGILGPNGAGKTTLIKLLTGIIKPQQGTIDSLGCNPFSKTPNYLSQIGVVLGQKTQLIWDLPAFETLKMLQAIYNVSNASFSVRLKYLTEKLQIADKLFIPVRKLSLGERIKFELVCSVIHSPKVLFLDEPTIGVDIVSQYAIYDFLHELNSKEKTTIILTSHYMNDIEKMANRIAVIIKGKIVKESTIDEIRKEYSTQNCYIIETQENKIPFDAKAYRIERIESCKYKLYLNEDSENILNNVNISNIVSIREEVPKLEEIIFKMFTQENQ